MHRCRHELEDGPYASGPENRRENRDRLNRDVALHDIIKQAIRRGYGPSYGGHMGMPGHAYGLGYGGYVPGPPFSTYGGHHGFPGLPGYPGPYGKGLPLPLYIDDYDSDDECPSTWYFSPPPHSPHPYSTTSPVFTSRRPPRSQASGRFRPGLPVPWAEAFEREHYHISPRPFMAHAGRRY